jgi:hypothetical protein
MPVLGRAVNRFGTARNVARLSLEEPDEKQLPEILAAGIWIDRMADALCVLDGVAIVLPVNAPLTFLEQRGLPAPARGGHAAVFERLGYRGPLSAAVRILPERVGNWLLARYIARLPDAGRRTAAIRAFGDERFFGALRPRPAQQDRFGRLHLIGRKEDPSVFVEVDDAVIAPDGTRMRYWLSVPPHVASAHEAVAETFGKAAGTYDPDVES